MAPLKYHSIHELDIVLRYFSDPKNFIDWPHFPTVSKLIEAVGCGFCFDYYNFKSMYTNGTWIHIGILIFAYSFYGEFLRNTAEPFLRSGLR